jgi:hypothetical protein
VRGIDLTGELEDVITYAENNPVKSGLVDVKERWPWSTFAGRQMRKADRLPPVALR